MFLFAWFIFLLFLAHIRIHGNRSVCLSNTIWMSLWLLPKSDRREHKSVFGKNTYSIDSQFTSRRNSMFVKILTNCSRNIVQPAFRHSIQNQSRFISITPNVSFSAFLANFSTRTKLLFFFPSADWFRSRRSGMFSCCCCCWSARRWWKFCCLFLNQPMRHLCLVETDDVNVNYDAFRYLCEHLNIIVAFRLYSFRSDQYSSHTPWLHIDNGIQFHELFATLNDTYHWQIGANSKFVMYVIIRLTRTNLRWKNIILKSHRDF